MRQKIRNLLSHGSGGQKSKTEVSTGPVLPEMENLPNTLSQPLRLAGCLCQSLACRGGTPSLCLFTWCSPCVCVCLSSLLDKVYLKFQSFLLRPPWLGPWHAPLSLSWGSREPPLPAVQWLHLPGPLRPFQGPQRVC